MDVTLPIRRGEMRRTFIRYCDAKGNVSKRIILPISICGYLDDDHMMVIEKIDARCETARAKRSFMVTRIDYVADFETGEVLGRDDWVLSLPTDDSDLTQAIRLHKQMAALQVQRDESHRAIILEEIQELRREKSIKLWRRVGSLFLLVAFVLIAVIAFKTAP